MWILYGGGKKQWTVLKHNGPYFPPKYKPHQIPIIVKDNKIILSDLAEEYATLYAKYIDSDYMNNNKFKKNFWKDFKKILKVKIDNLEDIDFSLIKKYLDDQSEKRKNMSKEEKLRIKKKNDADEEPYKYCIIDGTKQKVGNYKIEPPGIFLGRGNHPKIGSIKKRIFPEDVTINLDKSSPIPKPNLEGHTWESVIHNREVIWLATWKDTITGKSKYIFTSVESLFKSKSDEKKFNLARRLKRIASSIRTKYENDLKNEELKMRQLSTALYFIDNLALRVGGKKDKKEEADTVGVTSLRVEHITLTPPNELKLDFLGKDSIRYCKKINVITEIYRNLELFSRGKDKKELLFDEINSNMLNDYLQTFMKDLTAKVWRTYNASNLFQKEILKISVEKIEKLPESERLNFLISLYQQANAEVALLCNHQKAKTSNIDKAIERLNERIKKLRKQKRKYNDRMKKTKKRETKKNYKEKIIKIDAKIKLIKIKKETKSKMKNVSLETSKNNYIDPRIVFAFMKRFKISPDDLGIRESLQIRFKWASDVSENFRF